MKLTRPKDVTFWLAVLLAVLGLFGHFFVASMATYAIWLIVFAFVLLAAGNLVKGL